MNMRILEATMQVLHRFIFLEISYMILFFDSIYISLVNRIFLTATISLTMTIMLILLVMRMIMVHLVLE